MAQRDLLDVEHVVRQCSRQRQVRDEHDTLLGVTYFAFELRTAKQESYLSLAWLEHFGLDRVVSLKEICAMWTAAERKVAPKDALAICNVGVVRHCGSQNSCKLRVRHEPKEMLPAYAVIRGLPLDNSDRRLLEMLAAEAVVDAVEVRSLG